MEGICSPTYRFHIGSKGIGVAHDLFNGKGPCLNMTTFAVRVTMEVWIVVLYKGKEPYG
jgi:hypothetical protein